MVGTGLVMVKVWLPEVPPPGVGLTTVTLAVPAVATSLAKIVAVSCVAETKEVALGDPFQLTVDEASKPVPLAVRVNWALPAVVEVGDIEVRVGLAWVTVNVCALEVPPPGVGFTTVTEKVPAWEMSPAVIVAVI